jgi:hypothetical protein
MGELRGFRVWCAAGALLSVLMAGPARPQAPTGSSPAKTMLVEPPSPLLPPTLGKLKRASEGDVGDGLGTVDKASAPVLQEDGLKRFAQSDYAQGADHGNIAVYQFDDASGAISAYDYFRKPGMRPEKVGDNATSNGDELLMRSGINVVVGHFKLDHAQMIALTNELIDHLPKPVGTNGIAPLLPTLLPAKGLDVDSVKYALGPQGYQAMGGIVPAGAVGFDKSAEAVTAEYKNGGVLTLVLYPTPEIAGAHAREIDGAMKQAGPASKLRREGPLLALATGAWPAGDAEKVVDGVHLRSEVTFDKPVPPEFHAEIRKTYTLLESIAIFSGVGALAAVVLGLFFGFGRAGIRVLQGKPAATEPEFLRIDLSGSAGKNLRGPQP